MKSTPIRWIAMTLATALFGQGLVLQLLPVAASAQDQNSAFVQSTDSVIAYQNEIIRAQGVYVNANILAGTGKYVGKTTDQVRAGAHAYAEMLRKMLAQVSPPPKPTPNSVYVPAPTPANPSPTPISFTQPTPTPVVAQPVASTATDISQLMDQPPKLGLTSGSVKVSGNSTCISKTNAALNLLKSKASLDYNRVASYVGTIQCVDQGSGMWAWESPPRYTVGKVTLDADTMWYAGTIAHDSCHSVQYNVYKKAHPGEGVPASMYSGEAAEAQCLDVQYRALQRMGASSSTLSYMKTLLNTKYWTGDYSNRWW